LNRERRDWGERLDYCAEEWDKRTKGRREREGEAGCRELRRCRGLGSEDLRRKRGRTLRISRLKHRELSSHDRVRKKMWALPGSQGRERWDLVRCRRRECESKRCRTKGVVVAAAAVDDRQHGLLGALPVQGKRTTSQERFRTGEINSRRRTFLSLIRFLTSSSPRSLLSTSSSSLSSFPGGAGENALPLLATSSNFGQSSPSDPSSVSLAVVEGGGLPPRLTERRPPSGALRAREDECEGADERPACD
jgi:hypothetical protein